MLTRIRPCRAAAAVFVVKERAVKAKHLQLVSGASSKHTMQRRSMGEVLAVEVRINFEKIDFGVRQKLFENVVSSTFLYGSGTWTLTVDCKAAT